MKQVRRVSKLSWQYWLLRITTGFIVAIVFAVLIGHPIFHGTLWFKDESLFVQVALLSVSSILLYELLLHGFQTCVNFLRTRGGSRSSNASTKRSRRESHTRSGKPASRPNQKRDEYSGPLQQGTVRWYNHSNGYGFISPVETNDSNESTQDIFFHWNDVLRPASVKEADILNQLRDGITVEYAAEGSPRGPKAIVVKLTGNN